MTVRSITFRYPLYTIRSVGSAIEVPSPMGVFQDQTSGERLGLLFTSADIARMFMLRHAVDKANNEIVQIPTESRLVHLTRYMSAANIIDALVLDYGQQMQAVEIPLDELVQRVIPEDEED